MRTTYRVLALVIAALVVLQGATVAFGTFGIVNDVDAGVVIDNDYEANAGPMLHGMLGVAAIPLLSLALVLVSLFARVPGGSRWALFLLLAVVAQVALGFGGFGAPAIGLLHGANAFLLVALAWFAARTAGADRAGAAPAPASG